MVTMADRPVPDEPSQHPAPGEGSPPAPTEPLPPAPTPSTGGPAPVRGRPPHAGPPPGGAGTPHRADPPVGSGAGAVAGQQSTAGRLWGEATGTTGSRIVLATAAVLSVVVLLLGAGLVGSVVVHRLDGAGFTWGDDDRGRGEGHGRPGGAPFGTDGRGNGHGNGRSDAPGRPGKEGDERGLGRGRADGPGGAAGTLPGLGTVLHGRFTTTLTGRPAVMVFQVGEVTATTGAESLTVRSTDGFEATYTLDPTTSGTAVTTGDRVRVVAAEDGMTVVVLQVLGDDD
jgi:hypothetical protein